MILFYSQIEYNQWEAKADVKQWEIKYKKGLAALDNDEYDEIFFWNGEILYFENCQLWWDLIELTKMLTMEEKEYEMAIINYFKDRYGIESNEVFQNCDWDMDDVGQI